MWNNNEFLYLISLNRWIQFYGIDWIFGKKCIWYMLVVTSGDYVYFKYNKEVPKIH